MPEPAVVALNAMDRPILIDELTVCTPAPRWVDTMVSQRPYRDRQHLLSAAREAWKALTNNEIESALTNYLPLSAPPDSPQSVDEHAGIVGYSTEGLAQLREREQAYARRFGFPIVIAAKGLDLEAILSEVDRRISNDRATELAEAAAQMAQIGEGRLAALANSEKGDAVGGSSERSV
ncbi:2-oxo-4-hydroxy-4-carboxy-5-ureidoimidazoline decarboxylase [Rhodococcus sp. NPDC057529]|uniref:2-oxo-4-hydroxy-4-carboxy-5-ureidoimidazoline decarboxylase n=1 Tax=Rhodococcus sp. NPDC057529 TaxID=3346158 RepID=UPI0036712EEA